MNEGEGARGEIRPEVFIVDSGRWDIGLPKCEIKSSGSMGFPSLRPFSSLFSTVFAISGQEPARPEVFFAHSRRLRVLLPGSAKKSSGLAGFVL